MKMNQLSTLYRADRHGLMQSTGISAEPQRYDYRKRTPTGVFLGSRAAIANPCMQRGQAHLFVLFVAAK